MKAKEIREKSDNELIAELDKLKKELHSLRFKKVLGVVENPARFKDLRRDIARINTILQEKKNEKIKSKLK